MNINRLLFAIFGAILMGLFVLAIWHDYDREWVWYQQGFSQLEQAGGVVKSAGAPGTASSKSRSQSGGVKQTVLDDLERVDRCETCHLGIANPVFAGAPQPYTTHPGDYLQHHPIEKFGCTSCHWGQGYATTANAAHGDVKHWDEPMLRGAYIQASCGKCHYSVRQLPGAEVLARGQVLYRELGCVGCHTLHGEGGPISVDLTEIGSKTADELDFTFVEGRRTVANWMYEHFLDPQKVTPGFSEQGIPPSVMPNYRMSPAEAEALTAYMMSLTKERLTREYIVPGESEPSPVYASSVDRGRAVFQKFGCVGCHNVDGRGGRKNWNAHTNGEVPSLVYVGRGYTREELKEKIRQGVPIVARRDPSGLTPPLYMPAWSEKIKGQDLEDLVDYLLSLIPAEMSAAAPAPSTTTQESSQPETPAPGAFRQADDLIDYLVRLMAFDEEVLPGRG